MNTDYIVGSDVEVEQQFCTAKCVIMDHRKSISPLIIEATVLLKRNEQYWNAALFGKAILGRQEAQAKTILIHPIGTSWTGSTTKLRVWFYVVLLYYADELK